MAEENADYEALKKEAVIALSKIHAREPLGRELFDAMARLVVPVAIEAVCLRKNPETNKTEVLLTQRALDDTAYPGEWHCPGSVIRAGEEFADVFKRLAEKEFHGDLVPGKFVANFNNPNEARGHFFSVIYFCEVNNNTNGTWFAVDDLPAKTIPHHRNFLIPMATKDFLHSKE